MALLVAARRPSHRTDALARGAFRWRSCAAVEARVPFTAKRARAACDRIAVAVWNRSEFQQLRRAHLFELLTALASRLAGTGAPLTQPAGRATRYRARPDYARVHGPDARFCRLRRGRRGVGDHRAAPGHARSRPSGRDCSCSGRGTEARPGGLDVRAPRGEVRAARAVGVPPST